MRDSVVSGQVFSSSVQSYNPSLQSFANHNQSFNPPKQPFVTQPHINGSQFDNTNLSQGTFQSDFNSQYQVQYPSSTPNEYFHQFVPSGMFMYNPSMVRSKSRGRGYFRPRPICQVCGKGGHYALQCYHRFDHGFQGFLAPGSSHFGTSSTTLPNSTTDQAQALLVARIMTAPTTLSNGHSPYVNTEVPSYSNSGFPGVSSIGHLVAGQAQYPQMTQSEITSSQSTGQSQSSVSSSSHIIPIATPQVVSDQTWYVDSGATNHMTADVNNLLVKNNYLGGSTVQVGNGQSVHVTHTGLSLLTSPISSRLLHLKNMLCVPHIAKNLFSISQIT